MLKSMNLKIYFLLLFSLLLLNCLPDEKNWQEQRFPDVKLHNILRVNNQYIIFGMNNLSKVIFYTSTDGHNWQLVATNLDASFSDLFFFKYLNGEYVLYESLGNHLYHSSDLLNWFDIILDMNIVNLIFAGTQYVAFHRIGSNLVPYVKLSTDFITWSPSQNISVDSSFANVDSLGNIEYLNNKFYAEGHYNDLFSTNSVFSSNDGVHWAEISVFRGIDIIQKNYISNELIFVGYNGAIFKKENGNWVNHSVLFGPDFSKSARGRNEFVFAGGYHDGDPNPVLWSTDDFFIWRASQYDLARSSGGHSWSDEYDAWYADILYTGDFYIVTANECDYDSCEGIILTAE
jgi:hypothetical protein